jgi:hypothetical protein
MSPFLARRQYNTPILYIGVQRIACTDIEAAAKWPWKNDLSLRGNFGLHGKIILPSSRRFPNTSSSASAPSGGQNIQCFSHHKPNSMGMGFRISRTIVESHGGGSWASDNRQPSARRKFLFYPTQQKRAT